MRRSSVPDSLRLPCKPVKERYCLRVKRGDEPIGEYFFNATPEGLQQLHERIKPEFQYDILSRHGILDQPEPPEQPATR